MNPHHLELFYFVAKFEGITEAVRNMPYGIQQPAVSGQILQLEKNLGVRLFHRRPFRLTGEGEKLYHFITPFFSGLDRMARELSGEVNQHLRLAASAAALSHHLPDVLQELREKSPGLRLSLREFTPAEVEVALQKQEIDVAITVIHRTVASGIKAIPLIELPLTLLAPACSPVETFDQLIENSLDSFIQEDLVLVPRHEAAARAFHTGLDTLDLTWEPSMEVSEIILIEKYVARGFGFGLAVAIPEVEWPDTVKQIPLPEAFPPLRLGALYTGELKPVARNLVDLAQDCARRLMASRPG